MTFIFLQSKERNVFMFKCRFYFLNSLLFVIIKSKVLRTEPLCIDNTDYLL